MKLSQKNQWGSIAVSLGSLSILDRIFLTVSLAAALVLTFPHLAAAQTSMPLVFEVEPKYFKIYFTQEQDRVLTIASPQEDLELVIAADIDPRIRKLEEYLQNKNSPMADYTKELLEQYHYRLIIGIAFAESNFCKKNIRPHNCWGIGGGYPETYENYPQAFGRAGELIQKYFDNGMTSPKLMRNTWVGWKNDNWIIAVEQITQELESLGL